MILQRLPIIIVFSLCISTIYGLFAIKDRVLAIRTELQEVRKQIQNEADAIKILKAELAYLSSPDRIQKLAKEYLNLETPKVAQMIKDPLVAENNQTTDKQVIASYEHSRKTPKWRYKRTSGKYVTMAKE